MTQKSVLGYRLSPISISITWDDGTPTIVASDHPKYDEIRQKLSSGNYDGLANLVSPAAVIRTYLEGRAEVTSTSVKIDGKLIESPVVPLILSMIEKDEDPTILLAFLKNLDFNPSFNSRRQLWNFIEQNGVTLYAGPKVKSTKLLNDKGTIITIDNVVDATGFLVLYKGVNPDLTDCHTSTLLNEPGTTLIMDRGQVDDDPNSACSYGFHAGAFSYVQSFGTRKLMVLVNPADVVSVPHDTNASKVRCWRYIVLKEVEGEQFRDRRDEPVYSESINTYEVEGTDEDGDHLEELIDAGSISEATDLAYRDYSFDEVTSVELLD